MISKCDDVSNFVIVVSAHARARCTIKGAGNDHINLSFFNKQSASTTSSITRKMNTLSTMACESCMTQQEALLDLDQGTSQIICLCSNSFDEDETMKNLQNDAIKMDDDLSSNNDTVDATPKTRAVIKQPIAAKRKAQPISKLTYADDDDDEENYNVKKKLFSTSFPEEGEFDNVRNEVIRKWRDIPTNIAYQVIDMKKVGKAVKEFNVASLRSKENEQFKVWLTPRISDKLQKYDLEIKALFIKSFGLKPCKSSSKNYFDFSIVAKDL